LLTGERADHGQPRGSLRRIKEFAAAHTKRLLVVEDNDIERASVVDLLRGRGHRDPGGRTTARLRSPRCTTSVRLRRARPALPDVDGFELLDRMQSDPAISGVPVVVFTGKGSERRRGFAPEGDGQEHRAEGRAVARAVARRDRAVPASRA
jgi:CheY-like chemotaxis protein